MKILEMFLVSIGGATSALLIAGFMSKSFLSHLFNKEIENYKAELLKNSKDEDRQVEYDQIMKRYQGPLLHAVYELQSRLFNIVRKGLIQTYYISGNDHERDYVINNTVYVIAQYFAWSEIIRKEIQFIEFSSYDKTKKLSELKNKIYKLWQAGEIFEDKFMIWAGEQRAIGELMIDERGGRLTCIGYACFLKKLQEEQEDLFTKLKSDVISLSESASASYKRLAEIQCALIDILKFLDPEYIRFPEERRSYVQVNL